MINADSGLTLLFGSFLQISVLTLMGSAMAQQQAGCERRTISMTVSGDDTWVALVQEDVCSDGAFVTTVANTVQLVRLGETVTIRLTPYPEEPKQPNNVFTLDQHGRSENRPLIRWLSAKRLQITVPNKSIIGLRKSSYEGIEIAIKYEPDDPAERERWLKELGLRP